VNRQEFLNRLAEVLEMPEGSLTAEQPLADLKSWDSMAVLAFISMLDETLGVHVPAAALAQCKTVADLVALAGEKVAG
jgi:acyl carrier protein